MRMGSVPPGVLACNTGESRISYVIKELGVPEDYAAGTVRMTLSRDTGRSDIDAAVESLKRNIDRLRELKNKTFHMYEWRLK